METENHLEPGEGWGARGAEWARLQSLLELVRKAHREELSPDRREQIRERVLERLERNLIRRRRARFLVVAGVSAVLLGALLLMRVLPRLASKA